MTSNGHASPNGHDPTADESISFEPITLQGRPVPPRQWLVTGWIPYLTVTGLYGDGGVGKSLLAQQLATACALGAPWIGLPTQRVRTLAMFCEDHLDELHRRQADINKIYNCDFGDLEDVRWMSRFGEDNVLMEFMGSRGVLTGLFAKLLTEAKDCGAQLVIIDTVADTFGGNENDRGQVRQYIQHGLGSLAREIDGCVVALAHPSRAGISSGTGDSGSTGWSNSFRSRAFLSVPEGENGEVDDPFIRQLSRKKANYAARDETIDLRWTEGTFIPLNAPEGIFASIHKRTIERVFLDILRSLGSEGRHASDSTHAPNYAPKLFATRPDREGYGRADFKRAMETLFANGQIKMETYGRSHDIRAHIVQCNPPNA